VEKMSLSSSSQCGPEWLVRPRLKTFAFLLLLTFGAVLVHGYHLGIEDQAIYLPAVEKNLNPSLFPHDSQLFLPQTRLTLFDEMVAASVRVSHMSLETVVFLGQILSIFLLLFACWRLVCCCFSATEARWASMALIAALFTMPVAGTALYLVDQYLHPRTLATAGIILAIVEVMNRRWIPAMLCMVLAALLHLQMAFYGTLFCIFLAWNSAELLNPEGNSGPPKSKGLERPVGMNLLFPLSSLVEPGSDAWKEAARTRTQHYLLQWHWYEWLGAIAPVILIYWLAALARASGQKRAAFLSRRATAFGVFGIVSALLFTMPPQLERLTPYQPMRIMHLVTLLFVLLAGGFIGQYVLRNSVVRWLLLFVPLCIGMFYVQRQLFPGSEHVEFPGRQSRNQWVKAFIWVRANTPEDAYFVLDPAHMNRPGEDEHGFRAFSQRSMMADLDKDPGVVTLFPEVAARWQRETKARTNWNTFKLSDFVNLKKEFGVNWAIVEKPLRVPLICPYENDVVAVCPITD
jgi:hypothetical protein